MQTVIFIDGHATGGGSSAALIKVSHGNFYWNGLPLSYIQEQQYYIITTFSYPSKIGQMSVDCPLFISLINEQKQEIHYKDQVVSSQS